MAETAGHIPRPRLELSLLEARTRFVQLARLAGLTRQTTIVTDGGRPLAAIVPVDGPAHQPPAGDLSPAADPPMSDDRSLTHTPAKGSAAGWLRRIETLRAELQRQHTALEVALDEAWRELDRLRPAGSDDAVDALRLAHSDIRRAR